MNDMINSFLKSTSKSLGIINEVIPIYKDTYPIFKKIKGYIVKNNDKVVKEKKNAVIKKELEINDSSNPKFFV